MDTVTPLELKERAMVAKLAVRLQSAPLMSHSEKINMYCRVIELARAKLKPSELARRYNVRPALVYKMISTGRRMGLIEKHKACETRKAKTLVRQLQFGSMYALAQACGDDLMFWIVRNKPEGSTAAEFMGAILRDAMFEEEDEKNAKA